MPDDDRSFDDAAPLDEAPTRWIVPDDRVVAATAVAPPGPPPQAPPPPVEPPDAEGLDRALAIGLVVFLLFVIAAIAAAVLLTRRGHDRSGPVARSTSTAPVSVPPASSTPSGPGKTTPTQVVAVRKVAVPDVVGLSAGDAASKLARANLSARAQPVASRRPKGTVVSETPPAGSKARRGFAVLLGVAKGPPPQVSIPDLVGKSRSQAERTLREAGLSPRAHPVPSQQKLGTVIAQYPRPGKSVVRGTAVRINVARPTASTGPPPTETTRTGTATTTTTARTTTTVPDVTGLDEQEATSQLRNAGFDVQTTDEPTTDATEDGTVLDETPEGGARAPSGSTVRIGVGRFSS